ncbi:restriction endonuclease subunit S [Mycoplasma procyoni]|uniref:restriction endonuclease subunit S n=1 Tax=Mycoplasma procyoni TaxID=568784 RepID=UPI00197B65AE|nr:restriction endonuclease subunit S [Mycoplasma procyoni]MBN3534510.1 restriction endonuclease subunit S [Mycoplasma procyoni]
MVKEKLITFLESITDGTHSSVQNSSSNTNIFLLSCKNIKDGKIFISSSDRQIDLSTLNKLKKRTKLSFEDVVLTTVGTIGEVSIIKHREPNFDFQRSVAILKTKKNLLNPYFLVYYLSSNSGKNELISRIKGAVQPCLFLNDIKNVLINVPDLQTQQHIVNTMFWFNL